MKVRVSQDVDYKDIVEQDFGKMAAKCAQYSLTTQRGIEPFYALYKAIQYLVVHDIPGDIAECGVWRGGSVMLAAMALTHFGDTSRKIHLFDTFDGNPEPAPVDLDWDGNNPHRAWATLREQGKKWGFGGSMDIVRENILQTGYPEDHFVFVPGLVEETLPDNAPEQLALLRLDTDLYSSTIHELEHLYPRLVPGGVLIIDDYGYYQGARKATDEFLEKTKAKILLHRIDSSVRVGVKMA